MERSECANFFICMLSLLNQLQPTQLRAMCRVTSELFKQKFDLTITSSNKSKNLNHNATFRAYFIQSKARAG